MVSHIVSSLATGIILQRPSIHLRNEEAIKVVALSKALSRKESHMSHKRTSQAAKATGKLDEEDDIVVSRLGHGTLGHPSRHYSHGW
jgi:hypothetical protein